jgi:tight adherence protein B
MPLLVVGIVLVAAALAIGAVLVLLPRRTARAGAAGRTTASAAPIAGAVPPAAPSGMRRRAVELADDALRRRGLRDRLEDALELAGIAWQPASFVLAIVAAGIAAVGIGIAGALLRPGPAAWLLPVILLIAVLIVARLVVSMRTTKRRGLFADQLDDTLQLVASGLRAGHSLVRALDAVAREAESPTAEEFARVVNENRLGRDVSDALTDVATRMRSDDLAWVAQAVAVHREVGGNLGEVLDHAGETIRERGRIRRQVKALSAEGRVSAYILIALPVFVAVLLAVVSPHYIGQLVTTPLGWVLLGISLVLFVVGTIWMRRVVRVDF